MSTLLYSCLLFYVYFPSYPDHRHLHSFPTRRSSDLSRKQPASESAGSGLSRAGPLPEQSPATNRHRPPAARSEEHTSELQSHVNLVCRLLLEKKKNTPAEPTSEL